MKKQIALIKKLINNIRDMRKQTIKSDDLDEEKLYYLQEGFREGLCCAAMILADELDAIIQGEEDCPDSWPDGLLSDLEEQWWHTHNDEEGDIGSPDRY